MSPRSSRRNQPDKHDHVYANPRDALGYTNIKTQYSFMKSLHADGQENLRAFVPRLNE